MSQYSTGTASVTNGSPTVTGSGTLWLANVSAADSFTIAGDGVMYDVASVDSDTQVTLSVNYAGVTAAGAVYTIARDFTSPDDFPELTTGDIETPTIITRAIRKIQSRFTGIAINTTAEIGQAVNDHVALPDPHSQYAELSGGANANFTTMPQVGGDPIVESGSNSNGEYTKFSDGTLFCSGRKLVSGDDTNYFDSLYDIPVTPSSNTQNVINASLFGASGAIFTESVRVAMAPIGTTWRYSAYYDVPLSSAETYDLIWSYSGRWL